MDNRLSGIGGLAGAAGSRYYKEYACPSCKAGNKVYGGGRTIVSVCGSCRSILNISSINTPALIASGSGDKKAVPALPLGRSGTFMGASWRVIGYIQRLADGEFETNEYLLFSEVAGFRWLTEFDGNWTTVTGAVGVPELGSAGSKEVAKFRGTSYALTETGTSVITSLMGEFYWEPGIGDNVKFEDYVKGDEVLSLEDDGEETWSIGKNINEAEVKAAFGSDVKLPMSKGIVSLKSDEKTAQMTDYVFWWLLFAVLLIAIQGYALFTSRNEVVFNKTYEIAAMKSPAAGAIANSTQPVIVVTEPFELKGGSSNVRIDLVAQVSNSWMEFDGVMVEKTTGIVHEFEETVEYYYGVDQGESWSEGAQQKNVVLSSVPNGAYMISLRVVGSAEKVPLNAPVTLRFTVNVVRGVPMWGNFILALVIVSILPAIVILRRFNGVSKEW